MQKKRLFHFLSLLLFSVLGTHAQQKGINEDKYRITIRRATAKVELDGKLDEPDWQKADVGADFWQGFPYDTSLALSQTQVRLLFDDQFIYVGAVCQQPRHYIIQTLRRDFEGGSSDVLSVYIDPFRDKLNGFNFAVNPYGVQREGLVANGQELAVSWDNKWYSRVTNYDDHWVVEMAIPFKTLRYKRKNGTNEWNFNVSRNDLVRNERSSWAPIPRNFGGSNLAFAGTLAWDEPPPHPGANVSVIPYVAGSADRDILNQKQPNRQANAGFDAKVGVTPSLNLDLTVNPDFSQVEVDRQITNLSRFDVLFPERRQFFIENSDLFGTFGFPRINPFFSRQIGLYKDQNTQETFQIPILAGARLSGRLDRKWRVGLLNMQTARDKLTTENGLVDVPGTNYSVAAVQRQLFSRSNVGAIFVNKQWAGGFNRVAGLDYNLASQDGKWTGKAFYHRLFAPQQENGQYAAALALAYNALRLNAQTGIESIGAGYRPEVGFVPRNGIFRNASTASWIFYPKGPLGRVVNSWGIGPDYDLIYGTAQNRVLDLDFGIFSEVVFQNSARLNVALLRWDYNYIFSESATFDPTRTGGKKLAVGSEYFYFSNRVNFISNRRKNFFYTLQSRFGGYFNGRFVTTNTSWSYRWQPYGIFSLDLGYTRIALPDGYNSATLWLVGPRMEMAFTRNVFLTTFFQYNNQNNNVNLNARLQWRFKPVSDLFVVYTENYFANATTLEDDTTNQLRQFDRFATKNRALVLKLTYWLNI
ncbi:MAG: carbohydrate binding family 9 domain-containing protein [Cytophagales bacterium]|nr:carbohydrate binding family 9 domain-containing protein [Cytophagales bacterium]